MIEAATRGAGRKNLDLALSTRQDFRTSGALMGERSHDGYSHCFAPRLNAEEAGMLKADEGRIAYVVTSYATPIAWVMRDGRVHVVAQKFSNTTSKHQATLIALGE